MSAKEKMMVEDCSMAELFDTSTDAVVRATWPSPREEVSDRDCAAVYFVWKDPLARLASG